MKRKKPKNLVTSLIDVPTDSSDYMRRYMRIYRAVRDGPKNDLEKELVLLLKRARFLVRHL